MDAVSAKEEFGSKLGRGKRSVYVIPLRTSDFSCWNAWFIEKISGFSGSSGVLLVGPAPEECAPEGSVQAHKASMHLFLDDRYRLQSETQCAGYPVCLVQSPLWVGNLLAQVGPLMGGATRLVIDANWLSASQGQSLEKEAKARNIHIVWLGSQALKQALANTHPEHGFLPPDMTQPLCSIVDAPALEEKCQKLWPVHPLHEDRSELPSAENKTDSDIFTQAWVLLANTCHISWISDMRCFALKDSLEFPGHALLKRDNGNWRLHIFTQCLAPQDWQRETCILADLMLDAPQRGGIWIHPLAHWDALLVQASRMAPGAFPIAYDEEETCVALVQDLRAAQVTLMSGPSLQHISRSQSIKSVQEQQGMRQVHIWDSVALVHTLCWLDTQARASGATEWDVVKYLESCRRKFPGYVRPSFPTISATGPNSAKIHYHCQKHPATPLICGPYLLDAGGQYAYGSTDVSRSLWLGTEPDSLPSSLYIDRYMAVLKGHIALASSIFPAGTRGIQLDTLARSPLWHQEMDYAHATGHGVAYFGNVHQSPPTLASSPSAAQPGNAIAAYMVFSNEPGFYEENWGGIRLESLVLSKPLTHGSKFLHLETLTLVPFQKSCVRLEALDGAQQAWLKAYYEATWDQLSPLISCEKTLTWLREQTQL